MKIINVTLIFLSMFAVSACVQNDNPFCDDGSYSDALKEYLSDNPDLEKQIDLMNEYFDAAPESGKKVAPGAYAHMGLLYSKRGDTAEAEKYFILEKTAFPESAHYIDFIMNKKKLEEIKAK